MSDSTLSAGQSLSSSEDDKYKRLSTDMHKGLKDIYKHIHASGEVPAAGSGQERTDLLFTEAAEQLSKVLEATQKATESIMEKIERHMDMQAEMLEVIGALRQGKAGPDQLDDLEKRISLLGEDLVFVMTELSFQDLTGQRIKRVVNALKLIEDTVVDLYLSSGLIMKGLEESPGKNMEVIKQQAEDAVRGLKEGKSSGSKLKGPSSGTSQGDIDDLLAQLGM